jgi:Trk K+ transport system NAD-binding subunit
MRRIVIVGAGFFGRIIAQRLADNGIDATLAARRGAARIW